MNKLAETNASAEIISSLLIKGDLSGLNEKQKIIYYNSLCERIGIDPLTQPFKLLNLKGKEVLYCDRSGAQQLNKLYKISHEKLSTEKIDDVYAVYMRAKTPDGRYTDSCGAVTISGQKGDALANSMMKAETKAKRRATLDLCGLGMLDESEIETIPNVEISDAPIEMPRPKNANKEKVIKPINPAEELEVLVESESNQLQIITKEQWLRLVKNSGEKGYVLDDLLSYIKGLGYKKPNELNQWDFEDAEVYFSKPKKDRLND